MTVIVDGYATEYDMQGSGPVVLFLHGWGDQKTTFSGLTRELQSEYTVISLDLPGFGKTDAPRASFSLGSYASFVRQFLEKIHISTVYGIVGHSNGGAIAIKGIARGELNAEKLVLLASSGVRSEYRGRKKALRYTAKLMKGATAILPQQTQQKVKKFAYNKVGSDLFVAEHLQNTFKEVISEDVTELSLNINVSTLLVYGDKDEATPIRYGKKFESAIPQSQLVIVAGAGHFLHQTHATEVLRTIRQFLGGH